MSKNKVTYYLYKPNGSLVNAFSTRLEAIQWMEVNDPEETVDYHIEEA